MKYDNKTIIIGILTTVLLLVTIDCMTKNNKKQQLVEGFGDRCINTNKNYGSGGRCLGAKYRKTAGWCCSKYGRSKMYAWTDVTDPSVAACLKNDLRACVGYNTDKFGGSYIRNNWKMGHCKRKYPDNITCNMSALRGRL